MKILFDQGVPVPLRRHLPEHRVTAVFDLGWSKMANGALLDAAEGDGYELLITTDQNLKHQQNLAERDIAILVLLSTAWPRIQRRTNDIAAAVDGLGAGDYFEVPI